jgi:hypothetical protein
MKRCATCGKLKDGEEYNWRYKKLGIRHPTCKECHKTYRKKWYEKNKKRHIENVAERQQRIVQEARQFIWDYLATHPCVDCGESDPIVLEFDHVRGRKKHNISVMAGQGYSIASIQKEMEKTEVRCANCHRRKTSEERGWFIGGEDN